MGKGRTAGKRGIAFLFLLVMILQLAPQPVLADEYWPQPPDVTSPCAIVMEANTGTILYEKNAYEQHYPASITKIMTTLLALEYCDLDEVVVFSKDAVSKNCKSGSSCIWRDVNEELTMEQTLYAVMLASANECAYAVAEHVGKKLGGDYQTFIDLMNAKAQELGCTNTHFNNSNGLPDKEHWTCTYDMALIAKAAYANETFRIITGTKRYTIPPTNKHKDSTIMPNHHKMLYAYQTAEYVYEYCVGGKTGYTDAAKCTLVTYTQKDGLTLVTVVMYTTATAQFKDTTNLSKFFFNNYKVMNISENETRLEENMADKTGVLGDGVSFVTLDQDAYVILPEAVDFSETQFTLDRKPSEDVIASVNYTYGDKIIGSAKIVTTGVSLENNFFEEHVPPQDDTKEVYIKPLYVFLAIMALGLLILMIVGVWWLVDNFYVIRHNRQVRRMRRERFKRVKRLKKSSRKRDRIFR